MTNEDESSAAFLAELGQALKTSADVDAELAGIVVEHILTPVPAEDCLQLAMTAINALAASRVAPPRGDADG